MPRLYDGNGRVDSVHVTYRGDQLYVNMDMLGDEDDISGMQEQIDVFQQSLSRLLEQPVRVKVDLIPVPFHHFVSSQGAQPKAIALSDDQEGDGATTQDDSAIIPPATKAEGEAEGN